MNEVREQAHVADTSRRANRLVEIYGEPRRRYRIFVSAENDGGGERCSIGLRTDKIEGVLGDSQQRRESTGDSGWRKKGSDPGHRIRLLTVRVHRLQRRAGHARGQQRKMRPCRIACQKDVVGIYTKRLCFCSNGPDCGSQVVQRSWPFHLAQQAVFWCDCDIALPRKSDARCFHHFTMTAPPPPAVKSEDRRGGLVARRGPVDIP